MGKTTNQVVVYLFSLPPSDQPSDDVIEFVVYYHEMWYENHHLYHSAPD